MDPSTHSPGMQPMTARDLMLKLQQSRVANGAARIVPTRKRSFVPDSGFTTFTAGIRIGWQQEILSRKFRQAVAAEFMAMSLFVAFGSAVVVYLPALQGPAGLTPIDPIPRWLTIAAAFGIMISVMVFAVGDISGANLNPAVTLSLFLTKKMSLLRFLSYVFAQCMGAMVGSGYIKSLNPDLFNAVGGAANAVSSANNNNLWTALGGEILGTMLLVFTVSAAADVGRETHRKYVGALTPLCIGAAVFLAHLFLIPIDGCSINPARTFGSAVTMNLWTNHWVFWVGPMIGGPLAAFIYDFIFKMPPTAAEIADDVASAIERTTSSGSGDRDRGRGTSADIPSDAGSFNLPGSVLEAASPPRPAVSTSGVVTVKMPRMPPVAPAPQSQMPQILVPGMASVSANPMANPSAFRHSLPPPTTTTTVTGTTFRNSLVPSNATATSVAPATSVSPVGAPLLSRAASSRGVASPDHTSASTSIASGDAGSSVVEMASRQPAVGEWR